MVTARIKITTLLLSVGFIAIVELFVTAVVAGRQLHPLALTGLMRLLEIGLMLGVVVLVDHGPQSIGLSARKIGPGLKKGILWSAGFGGVAIIGFAIMYLMGYPPATLLRTRLPRHTSELILLFGVGGLIAPVAEEIFFRGILYGFLRRWGAGLAIMGSTVVFVALHPTAGFSLTQLTGGILFAAAYEIEDNLLVPIIVHVLGNNAIFMVSLIF